MCKFTQTENRTVATHKMEVVGDGKLLLHGYRVSVWDDKEVLEVDGDNGCMAM